MTNFDLVYSMFNPYVFPVAKDRIKFLKYYFRQRPDTSGNALIEKLLDAVETYNWGNIGEPLFNKIFFDCGKNPAEQSKIMGEIIHWNSYNEDQIKPTIKQITELSSSALIKLAEKESNGDSLLFAKLIVDYQNKIGSSVGGAMASPVTFDKVDWDNVFDDEDDSYIQTDLPILNRAFPNGLKRGQIGIVCAPPGTGKTLLSIYLGANMAHHGEKVLYASLGDNRFDDFVIRAGTIMLGLPFQEAELRKKEIGRSLGSILGSNFAVSINPAGKVDVDHIIETVRRNKYSVVILDYDGNLAGAGDGESMYNTFGAIYSQLQELTIMDNVLVIVCAQPKVFSWDKQIEMTDIGESSRKQHAADFILTISTPNVDCPNSLHTLKIVKARRGKKRLSYAIKIEGRFKEIPKGVYDVLKQETEEKDYTDADIDRMIQQYSYESNRIQGEITAKVEVQKRSSFNYAGPGQPEKQLYNPFAKQ